jgi:hypothetical protein
VKYKERKKSNKQNLQTRNYKKDARRGLGLVDKKDETKNISKERTKHFRCKSPAGRGPRGWRLGLERELWAVA